VRRLAPDPDDRMVVVRIIDRLNVGGPAIHAVLTAEGLDRRRFRTVLVTGSVEPGEADMQYLLDGRDLEVMVIPALGRELRPLRDLRTALKLYRLVRRLRPSVVHTHKAKAGALGRVVALVARVPVRVHTYHGHVFQGYFGPGKTWAFLWIERALARITSQLVALSPALADELSTKYRIATPDRFTVIPLGFELQPFLKSDQHRGELRRELGLKADVPLLALVGRMVPVKDHRTFVLAAAMLAAKRPDAQFVLVGGGELEGEIRQQIVAVGLQDRMHLLGWRRDLDRIYPDLDVVALCSINEGTPVSLIEAMACGIPVVATAVGGVPDVLHGGARGYLVPARSPAALADALELALHPGARDRAAALRSTVGEEYGSERLCADLGSLYSRLAT
jgi:glycosyltransferase involved in cell wall biosynthesis